MRDNGPWIRPEETQLSKEWNVFELCPVQIMFYSHFVLFSDNVHGIHVCWILYNVLGWRTTLFHAIRELHCSVGSCSGSMVTVLLPTPMFRQPCSENSHWFCCYIILLGFWKLSDRGGVSEHRGGTEVFRWRWVERRQNVILLNRNWLSSNQNFGLGGRWAN